MIIALSIKHFLFYYEEELTNLRINVNELRERMNEHVFSFEQRELIDHNMSYGDLCEAVDNFIDNRLAIMNESNEFLSAIMARICIYLQKREDYRNSLF